MSREEFVRIANNIARMYSKYIAINKVVEQAGIYIENDLFSDMMYTAIEALNSHFPKKEGVIEGYITGFMPEWIEDDYPNEIEKIKCISNTGELFDYLSAPLL